MIQPRIAVYKPLKAIAPFAFKNAELTAVRRLLPKPVRWR